MPGIIFVPFRKKDLEEPSLSVLNDFWRRLAEQINELWGLTGPVLLHDDLDLQGHRLLNANLAGAVASSSPTAPSLYGPHSNRPDASGVVEGTLYLETDRGLLYQLQLVSSVKRWVYIAGVMQGMFLGRPLASSLQSGDTGLFYHASDNGQVYKFTYPAWSVLNLRGGTIEGTHANRLTGGRYDAENLVVGTKFLETDRTVAYIVQVVAGVNTWIYASGVMRDVFANRPAGGTLGANDNGLRFFATDQTHEWRWNGTAWIVQPANSTPMRGTIYSPDQKPTLVADDEGFLFYSTDFLHLYRWTGTVWEPGPGDDRRGWMRGWGTIDLPGAGWHILDGSANVRISRDDGSTAVIAFLDNVTGHFWRLAGAYAGLAVAVAPAITGSVTAAATGISIVNAATGISIAAHSTAADTTVTGAATRVTTTDHSVTDTGHGHAVTDTGHGHANTLAVDITGTPASYTTAAFLRL
jgi:hypothetical protein